MSAKKYTPTILSQYHYWKGHGGTAEIFCQMKRLDRKNLSKHYCAWKKRRGIA